METEKLIDIVEYIFNEGCVDCENCAKKYKCSDITKAENIIIDILKKQDKLLN